MGNFRERRTFIRVDLPVPCKIMQNNTQYDAVCMNISATGMSVQLKTGSLKANDVVIIVLDCNDSGLPSLDSEAKVVRVIDEQARQYGLQFTNTNH